MISEKSYWTILIVAFMGFALLIWFGLMPYGIVEYNLGVNLFTSSIFMMLTILFISWLFGLREKLAFESTRIQLHKELGTRLFSISGQILFLIHPVPIENVQKTDFVKKLKDLSNESDENFVQTLGLRLRETGPEAEVIMAGWARRDKHFLTMELQTFQSFFEPHLRVHLVDIVCALSDLEYLLELKEKFPMSDMIYFVRVPRVIHEIIKEIHEISKVGIEIYPKQTYP